MTDNSNGASMIGYEVEKTDEESHAHHHHHEEND
jgi:hypothetical protein